MTDTTAINLDDLIKALKRAASMYSAPGAAALLHRAIAAVEALRERARAKDEALKHAFAVNSCLRIESSNGRILVDDGRGWDKAAKDLRKSLDKLDALDREDGT